jgi:hypothetical protein
MKMYVVSLSGMWSHAISTQFPVSVEPTAWLYQQVPLILRYLYTKVLDITSQVRLISEYICHAVIICVALQETEFFKLEATFIAIHDVYKLFYFLYFNVGCDTLYSGTAMLPLNMKTLCLSAVVLHTYQTAGCHKPEDNNMNGYHHTVSNLVYFLCVPVLHIWSPGFVVDQLYRGKRVLYISSRLVKSWMIETWRILARVFWSEEENSIVRELTAVCTVKVTDFKNCTRRLCSWSAATEIKPCDINYSRFSSICGEDVAPKFKFVCPYF